MTTHTLDELLRLTTPAVAISFVGAAPAGVKTLESSEAASCSYWRRAAAGEVFATEARHHLGCAVGAHTHGVATTPSKRASWRNS